jgi:hypothetical protein
MAWAIAPTPPPGASRTIVPSDDSPPNALDTRLDPLEAGVSSLTGLDQSFPDASFDHVVVGVDVRIVQAEFMSAGALTSGIGFLLIEDTSLMPGQPNVCIGLVLAPSTGAQGTVTIAAVVVPDPVDCFTVNNLMSMGVGSPGEDASQSTDGGDDAGFAAAAAAAAVPVPTALAEVLTNQWQHLTLALTRNADGSGTLLPMVPPYGAIAPIAIGPGSLAAGYPQIGIATSVTGPAGSVEVQFDNVTVDFAAP